MDKQDVIKAYFRGLEKVSYKDIIKLFSPNAVVHSLLYGKVEAVRFYKELFADTQNSKIVLKNIFTSPDQSNTAAAHFIYSWTMKDGTFVQFECVDLFEFALDMIESLTIIYDTYHTRKEFVRIHNNKWPCCVNALTGIYAEFIHILRFFPAIRLLVPSYSLAFLNLSSY